MIIGKERKNCNCRGCYEGNVAVKDGKIAAILLAGEEPEASRTVDAKGLCIPGCN